MHCLPLGQCLSGEVLICLLLSEKLEMMLLEVVQKYSCLTTGVDDDDDTSIILVYDDNVIKCCHNCYKERQR